LKFLLVAFLFMRGAIAIVSGQSPTFAHNAQHTSVYDVAAQHLGGIKWSTSVDIPNTGAYAHYGAPLFTSSNTALVSVHSTATNFQVSAFDATTGRLKYTLPTDYGMPTHSWIPSYQPVLTTPASGLRLYYPGPGGTVYHIDNIDADSPGARVQECFYTNMDGYLANSNAYKTTVFINTPLTADTNGVVYFGFRVQGTAPAPLSTSNSGFVRLDPDGNAIYVLAGALSGDSHSTKDTHNSAPALSNDGTILYVVTKDTSSSSYGYLLGLDSTTLAVKFKTPLKDPRNGNFAGISDDGTASVMVGPDDDVYMGVLSNPDNGSRGFLLHFSADLRTNKLPGAFGWDYTAAIVPTNMLPGYSGPSPYLLFSKYNNYAGTGDGNGINRIALLDPNAPQIDPHTNAGNLVEMREIMTVIGPTPDRGFQSSTYPYAVREWCINSAAVDPSTYSIFAPSEDGHIYRWNIASNAVTETFALSGGVGAPYVPTVIAPDGTVFTINAGKLFALGDQTNSLSVSIYSSNPDLVSVIASNPIVFTVIVTNLDGVDPAPTGAVDFQDLTYQGLTAKSNIFASAVPLINGIAAVTNAALLATGTYPTSYLGSHFITAFYSGDTNYTAAKASLMQKIHAKGTVTTLSSTLTSSNAVILSATVASSPAGSGTPTGLVSFWNGSNLLAQIPLNNLGHASLTNTNLAYVSYATTVTYASDTIFASSTGRLVPSMPYLTGGFLPSNGAWQLLFSNLSGTPFSVLGSTDLNLGFSSWDVLGSATEAVPGQFQFIDSDATNQTQRYYRVRSP
jgi:hypothetical protein